MAKRIIWSFEAIDDRKAILTYWINRNQSYTYSRKLNKLIIEVVELLALHPQIGRPTNKEGIRIKFIRDYALVYRDLETELQILCIFDTRQDPAILDAIIENIE
jgi:plasmid stabilization system protein ParE